MTEIEQFELELKNKLIYDNSILKDEQNTSTQFIWKNSKLEEIQINNAIFTRSSFEKVGFLDNKFCPAIPFLCSLGNNKFDILFISEITVGEIVGVRKNNITIPQLYYSYYKMKVHR